MLYVVILQSGTAYRTFVCLRRRLDVHESCRCSISHSVVLTDTPCVSLVVFGSDLSRPPRGVITPQFSCDTPNHLKFKGGYQGVFTGGVYVIVMEGVINNNKMLTMQST